MEDRELVALCRQGQMQHFATLVNRHRRLIFGLAWHLLKSKEEAEDASQEALLRVYRQLKSRADIEFLPYTKRVLSNLCLDRLRRRQVERKHLQRKADHDPWHTQTPEQEVMRQSEQQALREAILRLPAMYQEVLMLHYSAGLSYQSMAERLNQPMSIIKNRLYRAKRLLKEAYLKTEGGEEGWVVNK
ncbi:MAG: RNA polymerase sigma factor [Bacillota bacterium]|jgi:RNA polymerase sigma-70 factor (ECF subfamily)